MATGEGRDRIKYTETKVVLEKRFKYVLFIPIKLHLQFILAFSLRFGILLIWNGSEWCWRNLKLFKWIMQSKINNRICRVELAIEEKREGYWRFRRMPLKRKSKYFFNPAPSPPFLNEKNKKLYFIPLFLSENSIQAETIYVKFLHYLRRRTLGKKTNRSESLYLNKTSAKCLIDVLN